MNIIQIPAFSDNYLWLLHESHQRHAVVVDPGDHTPILKALDENNLDLKDILITHHHNDHIGGILELKKIFPDVNIYGPSDKRIPANIIVNDGENVKLNSLHESFKVIDVKGHTNSHVAYYFKNKLFCGDTLFSCGCGRLFEGSYIDMHKALSRIKQLPKETMIYCAHEYTLDNIGFAKLVDPNNADLISMEKKVKKIIDKGGYSIPSKLESELKINPFLRFDIPNIKQAVQNHFNIEIKSEAEILKYIREWKDKEYD